LAAAADRERLTQLFAVGAVRFVRDDFKEQLRELYCYQDPPRAFSPGLDEGFRVWLDELTGQSPLWQQGRWVYFPWLATLVHVLEVEPFRQLRASRNRHLISSEEQGKFAAAHVGIVGLSVGNSVALSLVLQGGANRISLADFDDLALSNTNRIRTSIADLGSNKAEMTARQIYELDPYSHIDLFTDGLNEANIEQFFGGQQPLNVVIDECDNIAMKYLIRQEARRRRLPVIMATDNGDNGIVDIERYDLDQSTPVFHDRLGPVSYEMLKGLDKMSIGRLATKFVGSATATSKMRASMLEVGKSIVSWPQLGGAALLNGCAVAYCVRAVVCGQPVTMDRALISLDKILSQAESSLAEQEADAQEAREFAKALGI
jgi:molybdopterin/thiamine biosynthesis adenylyltransferase